MEDFDPELLRAIMGMGGDSAQMDPEIQKLKDMVEQLRSGGPLPATRQAGQVTVAPTGIEHLGNFAKQMSAGMQQKQAVDLEKQQAAIKAQQSQRVMDALLKQRAVVPGMAPQNGMPMPGMGMPPMYGNQT